MQLDMNEKNEYEEGGGMGAQPEGQPYAQPYEQPYAQPYPQPEGQPYAQPYPQPEGQPYAEQYPQQYAQPEQQPYAQPEQQIVQPEAQAAQPEAKPSGKPTYRSPFSYAKLCFPILLFPLMYFPYTAWWMGRFAVLANTILRGGTHNPFELFFTGNNMILLFWVTVTAVVMLASIIISIVRVRPWFAIPIYLMVMFSLCGIFSLFFYTVITG